MIQIAYQTYCMYIYMYILHVHVYDILFTQWSTCNVFDNKKVICIINFSLLSTHAHVAKWKQATNTRTESYW